MADARRLPSPLFTLWSILVLIAALAMSVVVVLSPTGALLLLALLIVVFAISFHPPAAAYFLIGITPLVAGIDRGVVMPVLRPNEGVALLVGAVLIPAVVARLSFARRPRIRIDRVDWSILMMVLAGSVLPLLWMLVRDKPVTRDDLLHALTFWKLFGIFLLVRVSVRSEQEVARCLWISMAAAAGVAAVAVLQALQLFGVPQLLSSYYAPFGNETALEINRGSSTLSHAVAVADLMVFNLAVAVGWLIRGARHRVPLLAISGLFVMGALSSGQFSGAIALFVGAVTIALVIGRLKPLLVMAPAVAVAGLLVRPVIERRLADFQTAEGLPTSWSVRLDNLRTYFWPELFSNFNFVLGVRPSARIATEKYRQGFVWIESGHTWLLWIGGIPFLAAFFFFLWTTLKRTAAVARERVDAIGVAAMASFVSIVVVGILMILDPHLTYRGSGDILFALLALACTGSQRATAEDRRGEVPRRYERRTS